MVISLLDKRVKHYDIYYIVMSKSSEECNDLKNIQYKTMIMNGKSTYSTTSTYDTQDIEKKLEQDMYSIKNLTWARLDSSDKLKKLYDYADSHCAELSDGLCDNVTFKQFLSLSLDRNRLQKVKEINYDKETETVIDIPCLIFNKQTRHFSLKKMDKRVSTSASLNRGRLSRKKIIT